MTIRFLCIRIIYILHTRALNSKHDTTQFSSRASGGTLTHTCPRATPTHAPAGPSRGGWRTPAPGRGPSPHHHPHPPALPPPPPRLAAGAAPALPQRGAERSGAGRAAPGGGAAGRAPPHPPLPAAHPHPAEARRRVDSAGCAAGAAAGLPRAAPLPVAAAEQRAGALSAAAGVRGGRGCRCRPSPPHTHSPPPPPRLPGGRCPVRRGDRPAGEPPAIGSAGCEPEVLGEAICSAGGFARCAWWGREGRLGGGGGGRLSLAGGLGLVFFCLPSFPPPLFFLIIFFLPSLPSFHEIMATAAGP